MINLMGAWHSQLIEVLGAMGIREVRRLRGEMGRAIFMEEIEKEAFGDLLRMPLKRHPHENVFYRPAEQLLQGSGSASRSEVLPARSCSRPHQGLLLLERRKGTAGHELASFPRGVRSGAL